MFAVNVMKIREDAPAPEPREQEIAADDDGPDAAADVLGCVRATMRAPSRDTDPGLGDGGAMRGLTPTERRKTALRVGYAACLLPG